MEKTITVQGYFGDKQINRDDFIKVWGDHINELRRLSYSPDWRNTVEEFYTATIDMAGEEFDRLYREQVLDSPTANGG